MQRLALCLALTGCMPGMMNAPWGSSPGHATNTTPSNTRGAPAETERPPEVLAVTGSAKSLQRLTKDDGNEVRPRLSADGTRLMASSWRGEVVDGQYTGNTAEQTIVTMRPDGRGLTTLSKRGVAAFDGAWTPKGVVYISNAMGSLQLVRAAKATAGAAVSVVVRADDAPAIGSVSASKDGKLFAFHTQLRDVWTIATVNADGTDLMVVGEGQHPRISPDGKRIAYEQRANNRWQVFTMDIEGGDVTQVTDFDATNGSPEWSPDGAWIVFASNAGSARFADPDAVFNLFAIRADGTGLTQLTDGPRRATEPYWGSDGWIYFTSNEAGSFDLWRLKPVLE